MEWCVIIIRPSIPENGHSLPYRVGASLPRMYRSNVSYLHVIVVGGLFVSSLLLAIDVECEYRKFVIERALRYLLMNRIFERFELTTC